MESYSFHPGKKQMNTSVASYGGRPFCVFQTCLCYCQLRQFLISFRPVSRSDEKPVRIHSLGRIHIFRTLIKGPSVLTQKGVRCLLIKKKEKTVYLSNYWTFSLEENFVLTLSFYFENVARSLSLSVFFNEAGEPKAQRKP